MRGHSIWSRKMSCEGALDMEQGDGKKYANEILLSFYSLFAEKNLGGFVLVL